ncbi:MAG: site-specific DNA-methyltransferase [Tissierellia bacterium]|nr:site-specific DNA-methyltransferase [Tissierellia bacterium]
MQFEDLFKYNNERYFKDYDLERERGFLANTDCLKFMKCLDDESVDLLLTDIPYGSVNRKSNGLRKLDKRNADIITFDLQEFMQECYRICKGTVVIFCGMNQVSEIFNYYDIHAKNKKGTVRQLVWKKTNPSPMNGDYIYLSGLENAIWFKKKGGTFNAHCKSNVFEFPCGRSKLHPTEKNHKLLTDLILDNSKEDDIIFDPCSGSGSHCFVAKQLNRRYIGCELDPKYYDISVKRLKGEL